MRRLFSIVTTSFIAVLISGITLLSNVNSAHAVTITIYPIEDTEIDSDHPNDNYVGDTAFTVSKAIYYTLPTDETMGLMKFDLSNKIPKGSTVNVVTLRLMPYYTSSPTPNIAVYKYSNNDWNPMTATWNNFTGGTYQYLWGTAIPYANQYSDYNVLAALSDGIVSFAVKSTRTERGSEIVGFWSLNTYTQANRPQLIIDYTPSIVCTYTLSSPGASYTASGGSGSVSVTASNSSCTWTAVSNAPSWITVTSGSSGTGNGTIGFSVAANSGVLQSGTITIADQIFLINIEATTPPSTQAPSSGDGGGGGCFIATAAFGSPMEHHVQILRDFRDRYLLDSKLGQKFVNLYYQTSPQIAESISKSNTLRLLTRCFLMPIVGVAYLTINLGIMTTLLIITFVILLLFLCGWLLRRTDIIL